MMRIQHLILCVTFLLAGPAVAQRASLADRVTALEQQSANQTQGNSQSNIELLNKTTQMQDEIRQLRATLEQLQNELEQARQRTRDQYIDMDSRVTALEDPNGTPKPRVDSASPPQSVPTTPTAPAVSSPAETQAYQTAYNSLIKQGDAVTASRLFQDFLQNYPNSSLAPNAWYWLGESYYITNNYALALKSFSILNQQYPDSNKAPDAYLKTAYCHIEMKNTAQGKKELEQLIARYPNSPVADMARGRLRGLSLE